MRARDSIWVTVGFYRQHRTQSPDPLHFFQTASPVFWDTSPVCRLLAHVDCFRLATIPTELELQQWWTPQTEASISYQVCFRAKAQFFSSTGHAERQSGDGMGEHG